MDEFKKYIRQRAEDMDVDLPRERVWLAVKQEVKPAKPKLVLVYMKWAVAACVIALAGFGGYAILNKEEIKPAGIAVKPSTEIPTVAQNKQTTPDEQEEDVKIKGTLFEKVSEPKKEKLNSVKPKLAITNNAAPKVDWAALRQVENSFTQVINLQKSKVNMTPLNAESPSYFNDFKVEIRRMEKDEKGIKREIAKQGLTDELLEQLINVYQQKLNVLKQLQNEIHKTNNRFKQNRGPIDTTKPYFLNI